MNDRYPSKKELSRRREADSLLFDQARRSETDRTVVLPAGLQTGLPEPKPTAQVERLARRLGKDPVELARTIPPDTLRRTRFSVIEIEDKDSPEQARIFKHDPGIVDGIRRL